MLYRLLTGDKAISIFIILIIALLIWVPELVSFEYSYITEAHTYMPLYQYVAGVLGENKLISIGIALLFVIIQSFLLIRINVKYILIQQRTFLPALLYIILSGYFPGLHNLNEGLIASFFMIFTIEFLMKSYKTNPNSYNFFMAGLMLGIGSLFYAPLLYFIVFVWITTTFLRSFYWREYVFPVLGIITPYVFYFAWLIQKELNIPDFLTLIREQLFAGYPSLDINLIYKIFTAYLLIFILIGSVFMFRVFQFKKNYQRKFFLIMFWLFVLTILIGLIFSGFNTSLNYIVSIPVSYLLTNYLINCRKNLANKSLFYILILGSIFLTYAKLFNWI